MTKRRYVAWLLLLAVALAVRLAAAGWWHARLDGRFGFGDSDSYWDLARCVAKGGPYQYAENPVFRTPGYPALLAPLFLVSGDHPSVFAARLLSVACGVATVAAVGWLGRILFNARIGWLAACMAAIYPGHVILSVLVLSEAPFCLAMVVSMALWAMAIRAEQHRRCSISGLQGATAGLSSSAESQPVADVSPQPTDNTAGQASSGTCHISDVDPGFWALGAGVAMGVATLIRPSWLPFPVAALAVQIAINRRWSDVRIAALLLAGHMAILTPWWGRNYVATGHFVPTTLQVGASLYDGLNPSATGASDMKPVARRESEIRAELVRSGMTGQAEIAYQIDARLRREALDWASGHPEKAIQLAAIKVARIWNIWPNEASFSSWAMRLGVVFTYIPIAILGIMGAWRTRHRGPAWWLLWIPAGYLTLVHVVFVSSLRYREPAMLCVMVLAAAALVAWMCDDTGP